MRKERCVAADLLFCSDRISSRLKSPILHLFQVSLPTWVSKTFRLSENNLFSCHLGLLAQTLYCLKLQMARCVSQKSCTWFGKPRVPSQIDGMVYGIPRHKVIHHAGTTFRMLVEVYCGRRSDRFKGFSGRSGRH